MLRLEPVSKGIFQFKEHKINMFKLEGTCSCPCHFILSFLGRGWRRRKCVQSSYVADVSWKLCLWKMLPCQTLLGNFRRMCRVWHGNMAHRTLAISQVFRSGSNAQRKCSFSTHTLRVEQWEMLPMEMTLVRKGIHLQHAPSNIFRQCIVLRRHFWWMFYKHFSAWQLKVPVKPDACTVFTSMKSYAIP